ncbi:MAG: type I restriction endonuclease subunit R [Trebonia sp.]
MSDVGQRERATQDRVVRLLRGIGYDYLGNWKDRTDTSNVEVDLLTSNLRARGYDNVLIGKAVEQLQKAAAIGAGRDLYEANYVVYELLRYGAKVRRGAGEQYETVWLIDWQNLGANHFAVAEEVTVAGQRTKRPDIVLYVNGIAVVTLELKRSVVAVSEGIRQTIGNQQPEFIRPFFTTVQLVMAGNDVEGLRYALIDTPEKYWIGWRLVADIDQATCAQVDSELAGVEGPLDQGLALLAARHRLLEVVHDFIVFDAGVKKTCRPNQYFGVKAAQDRIRRREGGMIWHTQGSGKSLTMVWLAKWLRENLPGARVLLITDRTELDEQIEGVFKGVDEDIYRTSSGADLFSTLNDFAEWLICSLIQKFRDPRGKRDQSPVEEALIRELLAAIPKDFLPKGDIFVFVDEAHRTQSGVMHDAMKELLPGAMFIGFTGTPLLKADKKTTLEKFGGFIHTYKYDEAVSDGVVLDLRYEARSIDQRLTSSAQVDKWFEAKTRGMTDLSRATLKKRWGTMQKVISAEPRTRQIVNDILIDMDTKPRLADDRGNAILVCSGIYQACRFYELFCQAGFKGKCAIVTSYQPQPRDIAQENAGEGLTEKLRQYEIYRQMLADHFGEHPDKAMHRTEQFEKDVKERFIKHPGQMRLLIVVDKLLTGFDAPPATYLYIDKKMQDHGLFQAICRVNRLDGEDKDYGYVIDYQDLFNSLRSAIADYTGCALGGYDKQDVEGLLTDRLTKAKEDLDKALERVEATCEPVAPPKGTLQYQRYFCATVPGDARQLKDNEPKRVDLYKAVSVLARRYGAIANEMEAAGYTAAEAAAIKDKVTHYTAVRDEVRLGAGENIDFKRYEAGMRFLLDTYIQADASQVVADFADAGLVQLIAQMGGAALGRLPKGIRDDPDAVAETIVNNVRRVIIDEHAMNPKYYDKMSALLDDLIRQRQQEAISYKDYLEKLLDLAAQAGTGGSGTAYPAWAGNGARRALIDFPLSEEQAVAVDQAVMDNKPADWAGNKLKERRVKNAVRHALPEGYERLDELFDLIKARNEYR